MTKYLFDSGTLSAYIDRRHGVYERAKKKVAEGHRLGTSLPVVGEMAAGLERSSSRDRNLAALRLALNAIKVWPFDLEAAFEYGRLFGERLRMGRPMQTVDIQLAAVARTLGKCVVVTTDSDLSAVPGLDGEDWTTPQ